MSTRKRSTEELIFLVLTGVLPMGFLPIAYYRLQQANWPLAIMDLILLVSALGLFVHIWVSRKVEFSRWIIAALTSIFLISSTWFSGYDNVLWVYPALASVFFMLPSTQALIVSGLLLTAVTTMMWPGIDMLQAIRFIFTAFCTIFFCFAFSERMQRQQMELTRLAISDPLTGAGNRRALEERLGRLIERQSRYPELKACLILIDLDHFKAINDEHGHSLGDTVLKGFVNLTRERIRSSDELYRYGGEEFVVITENIDLIECYNLAESLRRLIESSHMNKLCSLTVSSGVAQLNQGESRDSWLKRADQALYLAKDNGRNRSCIARSTLSPEEVMKPELATVKTLV